MQPIKLVNNRVIIDNLIARQKGTMYDTYYKSLEDLAKVYIDGIVETVLNNSFLYTSDESGLARWQAYYEQKPFDMTWNEFKGLLFILNETTREGPTYENIGNLLKYFDPAATFSLVDNRTLYAGTPGYQLLTMVKGDPAATQDVYTSSLPWVTSNYNLAGNSLISYQSGGTLLRYSEGASKDYDLTVQDDGTGDLQLVVDWHAVSYPAPVDGETYVIHVKDDRIDHDTSHSTLYNVLTGRFPTDEANIYEELSSLPKVNEFFATSDTVIVYETSALAVGKISYRVLLQALLNKVLPANVVFLLRFMDVASILYKKDQGADPTTQPQQIILYEPAYAQVRSWDVVIAGQSTATFRTAHQINDTEFLVVFGQTPNAPWAQRIYRYDVNTRLYTNIANVSWGGVKLLPIDADTILIPAIESSETFYVVYKHRTNTVSTYYNQFSTYPPGTGTLFSPVFTNLHDSVKDVTYLPNGPVVFVIRNIQNQHWYIRVLDPVTNTLVQDIDLGIVTGQLNSFKALSHRRFVFWQNTGLYTGQVVYIDVDPLGVVTTTTHLFDLAASYWKGFENSVIAKDDDTIIFTKNLSNSVELYTAAFGDAPVLKLTVSGMPSAWSYLHGNDIILANPYKSVAVVRDFLLNFGTSTVNRYHIDSDSMNIFPVEVF